MVENGRLLVELKALVKNIDEIHNYGSQPNKYVTDKVIYFSDKWFFDLYFNVKNGIVFHKAFI